MTILDVPSPSTPLMKGTFPVRQHGGPAHNRGPADNGLRACWAFSSRWGGVSAAPYAERNLGHHVGDDVHSWRANRETTARELGLSAVAYMHQVHGQTVTVVNATSAPRGVESHVPDSDALVTSDLGLGLAVMVADCVPLLMAYVEPGTGTGVVAAVHAGRRGVLGGVALQTLEHMTRLGADVSDVHACIGPAICGRCYEVPPEMADEVEAVAPESAATTHDGTRGLDLRQGLAGVLRTTGLASVELVGACTRESEHYFSYRKAEAGRTGRFAGFAWLTPPSP